MNLSRLLRRHDGPTLRERLTATTARLQVAKDRRVAPAPPAPEPEPVDRAALVNYATFLALERERVCAELYPHMGPRASRFVLMLNAAERFFYPDGERGRRPGEPPRVPPGLDAGRAGSRSPRHRLA